MIDLTPRQIQILRAIIQVFIESAEPVGSETIDRKFSIGASPATIRNEMVELTRKGYLRKIHSSAGRLPTPTAMKLYVNELMKEKELTVADEVSAKEKIWHSRNDLEDMMAEIARVLAERSRAVALSVVNREKLYSSGYANLLNMPEFYDINVTRQALLLIEEVRMIEDIFTHHLSDNQVQVVYGAELGNKELDNISIIFTCFDVAGVPCHIGVLGSSRFDYAYLVPFMKYVRNLAKELGE